MGEKEEQVGGIFDGLGTQVVGLVVETPAVKGDGGMVRATIYDGSRNIRVTAWGEDGRVSELGRVLMAFPIGARVSVQGPVKESDKYGPELSVRSIAAA